MENKLAIKTKKSFAENARKLLIDLDIFDHSRKIIRNDDYVELPVIDKYTPDELMNYISNCVNTDKDLINNIEIVTQTSPVNRIEQQDPFEIISEKCNKLVKQISSKELKLLPRKWELLGDVLVLKFPAELEKYNNVLAQIYAEVLGAVTVIREKDTIKGPMRIPTMEILYGNRTETIHKENGILFKFDALKLIFSSGNIDERARIAEIPKSNETIVDMFAGIGYFTLPIAIYSRPKKIYACEINPVALEYLRENIKLNRVENIVKPILGDNRITAPENVADRVIMGYIKNTEEFLPHAFQILKNGTGIIHYHNTCPNDLLPDRPFEEVQSAAMKIDREVELLNYYNIKSYAPGVSHIVIDVMVKQ